ncbi:hypothetical protein ACFXP7_08355 [Microbacterium sp. P06]|uniref:hypothetical protein n=1 Tax=Microbacterium sp. P06 TaxID=3366949 RepID=UPI003745101E
MTAEHTRHDNNRFTDSSGFETVPSNLERARQILVGGTPHSRWDGEGSPSHESKFCTRCKRQLPIDAFGLVRPDRPWRRSKCNECEAERKRESRKGTHHGNA